MDRFFTRADLLSEIWPDEVVVLDRVVDVNITRIRQKIGLYGKNIVTRSAMAMFLSNKFTYPQRLFMWLLGYSLLLVGCLVFFNIIERRNSRRRE